MRGLRAPYTVVTVLRMFLISCLFVFTTLDFTHAKAVSPRDDSCTLKAGGSDDSLAFVAAVTDPACSRVVIPQSTTLNIKTRMDMTNVKDKHIVGVLWTSYTLANILTVYWGHCQIQSRY